MIENHESIEVFIGLDVGKGDHHAVALDRSGTRLLDQALPNDEGRLRLILQELESRGRILLVVDKPATIGGCRDSHRYWQVLRRWSRAVADRTVAPLGQKPVTPA